MSITLIYCVLKSTPFYSIKGSLEITLQKNITYEYNAHIMILHTYIIYHIYYSEYKTPSKVLI